MAKIYDVAIIGAGITGAAAAYYLAHRKADVVILEKAEDVCAGVSRANSGIIHGGFHYPAADTLKGKLELAGNLLYDQLYRELDFSFERCGILVAAFSPEEMLHVKKLYRQGVENGVPGIELCDAERMYQLESKLSPGVCGGLYAPGGGVVEPYTLVYSFIDAAERNGLTVMRRFEVSEARDCGSFWKITSSCGKEIYSRYVINAAGLFADTVSALFGAEAFSIRPRKGEEYLLDRRAACRPSKVIFPVPTAHSKGVLVIPTAGGTTMIGPTAELLDDKDDAATSAGNRNRIFALAEKMVQGVSAKDLISGFAGSRPVIEGKEDFFIARSETAPRLIQTAGIQSPGLTAAPAVAGLLIQLLEESGLELPLKEDAFIYPEKVPAVRNMSAEQVEELYALDPAWGNIICRCEKVSEAEIRIAVRRGRRTLDAVKLATRAGMGRCQSGFCALKIMHIIADELNIPLEDVLKKENKSNVICGKLGD